MTEYVVNTVQDMAAIPDEALPRFLEELPHLIAAAKVKREMIDAGLVKDAGDFRWRDDGAKAVTAKIKAGNAAVDVKTII